MEHNGRTPVAVVTKSTMTSSEAELRSTFFARLQLARVYADISKAEIARRTRSSDSSVSTWFDPRVMAMPEGIKLLQLPWALGVNGHWLLTGEGHMLSETGEGQHQVEQAREAIARAEVFLQEKKEHLTQLDHAPREPGVERRHAKEA